MTVEPEKDDDSDDRDHDQVIEDMFNNFNQKIAKRPQTQQRRQVNAPLDLNVQDFLKDRDAHSEAEADAFDHEKKTNEFGDNQFWKAPEMYDIDDLLKEQEDAP